jgi:MSHA biogenesis protein MshN
MSVINQMLVDLERRRASGEERHRIPDHVRALPDEPHAARGPVRAVVAAAGIALLVAAVWWWQTGRTPAVPAPAAEVVAAIVPPPAPAPVLEPRETEFIARRLTLDLAYVPEPETATAAPLATTSVIRPNTVSAVPPEMPVEKPAEKPAEKLAEKPRAVPVVKKTAEPVVAAAAPVEIDKKVRKPTPRQRAEAEYAKGAAARQLGRADEARAAFESALQIDPTYHGARQALVGTLLEARLPADAMKILQEGLQLAPAQQGFAMTLARLQLDNGELDVAAQTLANSLDYPEITPDYIAFYASLLQRQQKHAEAATQFQRALARRRNVGVWLLGLGVSFEALGRGPEAQEAYRLAKSSGNLSADLQAFADQKLR